MTSSFAYNWWWIFFLIPANWAPRRVCKPRLRTPFHFGPGQGSRPSSFFSSPDWPRLTYTYRSASEWVSAVRQRVQKVGPTTPIDAFKNTHRKDSHTHVFNISKLPSSKFITHVSRTIKEFVFLFSRCEFVIFSYPIESVFFKAIKLNIRRSLVGNINYWGVLSNGAHVLSIFKDCTQQRSYLYRKQHMQPLRFRGLLLGGWLMHRRLRGPDLCSKTFPFLLIWRNLLRRNYFGRKVREIL